MPTGLSIYLQSNPFNITFRGLLNSCDIKGSWH